MFVIYILFTQYSKFLAIIFNLLRTIHQNKLFYNNIIYIINKLNNYIWSDRSYLLKIRIFRVQWLIIILLIHIHYTVDLFNDDIYLTSNVHQSGYLYSSQFKNKIEMNYHHQIPDMCLFLFLQRILLCHRLKTLGFHITFYTPSCL